MKIVVIGGGAAGLGAAGAAQGVDPLAKIVSYTKFEDVAYSPCGIPFVHGKEIESFDRLFLATKQQYADQGIDIHYTTTVDSVDVKRRILKVAGEGEVKYDRLIFATGWNYEDPGLPGGDLRGIYRVKNIREAAEWDKYIDGVKSAVVVECGPIAVEMVSALTHRGIKVTVVDPAPWPMANVVDPDIIEPVRKSWEDSGVTTMWGDRVTSFGGNGTLTHVETTAGRIEAQLAIIGTRKVPNTSLAKAAGLALGATGGIAVDARMRTSVPDVFAAGDCIEIPHGVTQVPLQGLSGSHAYAQGKTAGINAAGGHREYHPVYVPWAMLAGDWMIGGISFGETTATALGVKFVSGTSKGITRARYYPGVRPITVKLLADPTSRCLIGAQIVGGEGVKERADFLGVAIRSGISIDDLASMENVYSPAIGALNEPIAMAAQAVQQNFRRY
ncbi:FAD-dependent oxidoreductase [Ensifer sp. ENS07]|uniref:FAD-dependent oxidoreductase n=1 Tax=unclassified Ensifer TaxID=2633371 RepID=UPI001782E13A|nr:FAD-dependent oxidoreductase [Ensifer sp. ENS10]MBD9508082.1 FAD-dependent oxidoreductase [Ensifer sp. ENS10]MBD9637422.1 FAD-dependent oxidoreductase [Ensifer sp. ENS07]